MKILKYFPKSEKDELYISSLAVFEEYRGIGVATRLIEKAENMALDSNLNKLSLFVEINNYPAINLYKKCGFRETKKVVLPGKYSKHNLFGYNKMIKELM